MKNTKNAKSYIVNGNACFFFFSDCGDSDANAGMIDDNPGISDHEYAFPIDVATSDYESRFENENPYNNIEEPFEFVRNSCYVDFQEIDVNKLKVTDEYCKVLPKSMRETATSCAATNQARTTFDEYARVLPKSQRHQHGTVHKGGIIDLTKNGPCDSTNANGEKNWIRFIRESRIKSMNIQQLYLGQRGANQCI